MSVRKFCLLLGEAKVGKNDKKWFPKWIRSYVASVAAVGGQETAHNTGNLSVTRTDVIRLPVVLSRREIALLLPAFVSFRRLMFQM